MAGETIPGQLSLHGKPRWREDGPAISGLPRPISEPEAGATATTAAAPRAVATTAASVAGASAPLSEGLLYKRSAGVQIPASVEDFAVPGLAWRSVCPASLRISGPLSYFLS